MLKSHAEADLKDAIAAYCRGSYDTLAEAEALHALIAGEPCILSTGSYHNQTALRISRAVNRGDEELVLLCLAFAGSRSLGTVSENVTSYVLDDLVGVNDSGKAILAQAKARFAPVSKSEAA
jgi:hypothetical protein